MNNIDKQNRYKNYRRLYGYGTFLSLFLLSSIFAGGKITLTGLLSFFLLLPLPLYFAIRTYKAHTKINSFKNHAPHTMYYVPSPHFSLSSFLTQPSLSFRLSLILLALTLWTGLARSYTEHKNLQANNNYTFNSILPTNN